MFVTKNTVRKMIDEASVRHRGTQTHLDEMVTWKLYDGEACHNYGWRIKELTDETRELKIVVKKLVDYLGIEMIHMPSKQVFQKRRK